MSIPTIAERLEQAQTDLASKDLEIVKLTADLTAANQLSEGAENRAKLAEDSLAEIRSDLEKAKTAISEAEANSAKLAADNAALASKEQDVEKRASARLAAMQAELGVSPPLPVGAPAATSKTAGLKGLALAIAAREAEIKK